MKSLQQHLMESLETINEAFRNLKVYCVGRGDGPVHICKEFPTKDPYNSDAKEGEFNIYDTDWLTGDLGSGTGSLAFVAWCDENIYGKVLNKVNDEKALRKEFDKAYDRWYNDPEYEGENIEYIYFELDCGLEVDMSWEDYEEASPDNIWDAWMKQFNDSYVDGDSGYCRCLVDLKKKKVIAGGADINFDI